MADPIDPTTLDNTNNDATPPVTTDTIPDFTNNVIKIIQDWFVGSGFKDRKLTDTPTDRNQVVPKGYVDDQISGNAPTWKVYKSFTWVSQDLTQSFPSLPAHDQWLLTFYVDGGTNGDGFLIQLNSIASSGYFNMTLTTSSTVSTHSGASSILFFQNSGDGQHAAGNLYIGGRYYSPTNSVGLSFYGQSLSSPGTLQIFGPGSVSANTTDLQQIDILATGHTNWTGKGQLLFRDLT